VRELYENSILLRQGGIGSDDGNLGKAEGAGMC
jgi:hypothetical protein